MPDNPGVDQRVARLLHHPCIGQDARRSIFSAPEAPGVEKGQLVPTDVPRQRRRSLIAIGAIHHFQRPLSHGDRPAVHEGQRVVKRCGGHLLRQRC